MNNEHGMLRDVYAAHRYFDLPDLRDVSVEAKPLALLALLCTRAVLRTPIEWAGLGDLFVVRGAYSIGIAFAPSWGEGNTLAAIKPGSDDPLLPGMTFHLVPALYRDGVGCVCCSMPVAITDTGVAPLATIEPKLFIL